jgi:hypothetical protein
MENPMHVRSPPPNSHPARTHRSGGKPSHALCMARAPRVGQLSRRNRLSFLFSETHVSTTLKIEPPSAHVRSALLCSALLSSPSQPLHQPPPPPCHGSSLAVLAPVDAIAQCLSTPRSTAATPRSSRNRRQPPLARLARLPGRLLADVVELSISGELFVFSEFAPFSVLLRFHFLFTASRCLSVLPRPTSCRAADLKPSHVVQPCCSHGGHGRPAHAELHPLLLNAPAPLAGSPKSWPTPPCVRTAASGRLSPFPQALLLLLRWPWCCFRALQLGNKEEDGNFVI